MTWPQFTGEWNKLIEVFEFNFPMNSIFYCFINQRQELFLIKKIARQFCQSLQLFNRCKVRSLPFSSQFSIDFPILIANLQQIINLFLKNGWCLFYFYAPNGSICLRNMYDDTSVKAIVSLFVTAITGTQIAVLLCCNLKIFTTRISR